MRLKTNDREDYASVEDATVYKAASSDVACSNDEAKAGSYDGLNHERRGGFTLSSPLGTLKQ